MQVLDETSALDHASGLINYEKDFIRREAEDGTKVLKEASQLCRDAVPRIYLIFNETNMAAYAAELAKQTKA
jgi:hypothetical protein